MQRIFIPCDAAEQWKRYLADPGHWKTGYSAKSLAYCWQDACENRRGLPREIAESVDALEDLRDLEVLLAVPEHEVALPGGARASQTDLWFLGATRTGTISVAVEGKAKESFGTTVRDWLADADVKSGKPLRLKSIRDVLGLPGSTDLNSIRYQLLHRTASAVLEARRFRANAAMMLVHSFKGTQNFDQFREFTALFGQEIRSVGITQLKSSIDIPIYVGWIRGDSKWLAS
jgi:hypothetical protein